MTKRSSRGNAFRRYPGLAFILAAAALAILLPTALNVPQSGPSTLAEFAPVPGSGQGASDLSDLGAVSTGGLGFGGSASRVEPPPTLGGPEQRRSRLKRCVGSPPRQTEDPLSPPCVGFFEGNNFGSTYRGVTRDEVRVLIYAEYATQCATSRGCENGPARGTIVDLGKDPAGTEYVWLRMARAYQRYFNDRFQTYGRAVHFYYHAFGTDVSPAGRRHDAAVGIDAVDPFAVIAFVGKDSDAYVSRMAESGVMVFPGSDGFDAIGQPEDFYRKFPGRVWSYLPSLEQKAAIFNSYVCRKVVPHKVSFSGNSGDTGSRRLGLLWGEHPARPDLRHFADLVRKGVQGCGGNFVTEGTYQTNQNLGQPDAGAPGTMGRFQTERVSTIIWAAGLSQDITRSAAGLNYRPEIVVAGDGLVDGTSQGQLFMEQSVWHHARAVSGYTVQPAPLERVCVQAVLETGSSENPSDVDRFGCRWYSDFRQLFIGIQAAGPRLSLETIDKGFHSIPDIASTNPTVPACFYRSRDYSCVKDAASQWWDRAGQNRNNTIGCWRMMQAGKRYLTGAWPEGDVDAQRSGDDICNLQNFHPVA